MLQNPPRNSHSPSSEIFPRCWTITTGKGKSGGRLDRTFCSAFRPPVDVPITTISKDIKASFEFRVPSSNFLISFRVRSSSPFVIQDRVANSELETRNSKLFLSHFPVQLVPSIQMLVLLRARGELQRLLVA